MRTPGKASGVRRIIERWSWAEQLARILQLARHDVPYMLIGTGAAAVSSGSLLYVPWIVGQLVDKLGKGDDGSWGLMLLVALAFVGALSVFLETYFFWMGSAQLANRLRKQMYESLLAQELAFFEGKGTGEIMADLGGSEAIRHLVTTHVSAIVRHGVQVLGGVVCLLRISIPLTAVICVAAPLVSISAVVYMMKVMNRLGTTEGEASNRCTASAYESVANARTVKAFSQEGRHAREYAALADAAFALGRRVCVGWAVYDGAITCAATLGAALLVAVGGRLVAAGRLTAGDLSSFFLYASFTAVSIALLSRTVGEFARQLRVAQRALQLLERVPRLPSAPGSGLRPASCAGFVAFEDVSFAYGAERGPVLRGVSLALAPGRVTALVGPSGGGKTSIGSLLLRLYDPTGGRITLDGYPLTDLDPCWVHRHCALVSQEPVLFGCSVAENIAYGLERPPAPGEVEAAARAANAHDFIQAPRPAPQPLSPRLTCPQAMPEGYRTPCGERGGGLSGGQRQRIAIARALLLDPRVLVLDEATSALDAESEHAVQEALARLMAHRTVLVIAHRLSTVRAADEVLVVEAGRVVERGAHDELVARGGLYARLVRRQLREGDWPRASPAEGAPRAGEEEEEAL
eukprot:tig00000711_g3408.t1